MKQELARYEVRLYKSRLAEPDTAVFGVSGETIHWNRRDPACTVLEPLCQPGRSLCILYARTAEPYRTVLAFLAEDAAHGVIRPDDCETRAFLLDLPVAEALETETLAPVLESRKCAVLPDGGIVVTGADPSEAYVNFSAACFAAFVKFFADTLRARRNGKLSDARSDAFSRACGQMQEPFVFKEGLMRGPFKNENEVRAAMSEAGREMIRRGLVDACFGNASYRLDKTLYITASGSFLDELEGGVVAADMQNGACAAGKPSSELPAHMEIAASTHYCAVLHGHPLFSVIMSMDCRETDCPSPDECYRACPRTREIRGIPVVSGEIGGGPYGLCHTVPAAIRRKKAAIVYGHGVFTCARDDFNGALGRMATIEQICRKTYFEQMSA